MNIYTAGDEETARLRESRALGKRLAALARRELEPWCARNRFVWGGFRYSSPEWKRRS
jgi:hypothetical protein